MPLSAFRRRLNAFPQVAAADAELSPAFVPSVPCRRLSHAAANRGRLTLGLSFLILSLATPTLLLYIIMCYPNMCKECLFSTFHYFLISF
jgi:hypothetical protein